MADYLVGLFLKYSFRVVIAGVGLCLVIEVAMQVDGLGGGGTLKFQVFDLVSEILSPPDRGDGTENLVIRILVAALETSKVWMLSLLLTIGFGIPLGIILGRLGCVGRCSVAGRRVMIFILAPCLLPLWLPAFGLASLAIFYLIDISGVPVFELMKNGGQGFEGEGIRVVEWWRLLLPAGVVAVSGFAWLAGEVMRILWMTHQADFVRAAEDRGLSGDRLFFAYTVNNSMNWIGGAILRSMTFLLGSLILVEWVFHYPGLGAMVLAAAAEDDFASLLVAGSLFGLMVMVAGFLLEGIFGMIDKNTRMEGGVEVMRNGISRGRICERISRARRVRKLKLAWLVVMVVCGVLGGARMLEVFSGGALGRGGLIEPNAHRILMGASGTLVMALMSSILAVFISFCLAGLSGCLGGWQAYCLIAKTHAALITIPVMFWMIVGLTVADSEFWVMVLILGGVGGLLGVGVISRWFLDMELRGWIEAAKATGLKRRQIFLGHFIPAIWPRIVSRVLLLLPTMLLFGVAADFSGLVEEGGGSDRWGILMAEGQGRMLDDPELLILSVAVVWVVVASIAVMADWAKFKNGDQPEPDIY